MAIGRETLEIHPFTLPPKKRRKKTYIVILVTTTFAQWKPDEGVWHCAEVVHQGTQKRNPY